MAQLSPYLFFNRNCEEAFTFYKHVFNSEFDSVSRYKDVPPGDNSPAIKPEDGELIMNIGMRIKGDIVIMGSDSHPAMPGVTFGNHISLAYTTDSKEETEKIFNALCEGGRADMPLADTFWGAYFGMLTDKFGIKWMVSFG